MAPSRGLVSGVRARAQESWRRMPTVQLEPTALPQLCTPFSGILNSPSRHARHSHLGGNRTEMVSSVCSLGSQWPHTNGSHTSVRLRTWGKEADRGRVRGFLPGNQ